EIATVEITAVRALRADARVVSESAAGAIVADTRAVERTHAFGSLRMRVQLAPQVADAEARGVVPAQRLHQTLNESPLLEVVGADDPAAARIYLIEPRTAAGPNDPVPQLGAVAVPTWAVVSSSGELQMPPKPLDRYLDVRTNLDA